MTRCPCLAPPPSPRPALVLILISPALVLILCMCTPLPCLHRPCSWPLPVYRTAFDPYVTHYKEMGRLQDSMRHCEKTQKKLAPLTDYVQSEQAPQSRPPLLGSYLHHHPPPPPRTSTTSAHLPPPPTTHPLSQVYASMRAYDRLQAAEAKNHWRPATLRREPQAPPPHPTPNPVRTLSLALTPAPTLALTLTVAAPRAAVRGGGAAAGVHLQEQQARRR